MKTYWRSVLIGLGEMLPTLAAAVTGGLFGAALFFVAVAETRTDQLAGSVIVLVLLAALMLLARHEGVREGMEKAGEQW